MEWGNQMAIHLTNPRLGYRVGSWGSGRAKGKKDSELWGRVRMWNWGGGYHASSKPGLQG